MLTTNLKIAFRNLIKYKTYSLINIVGLALGLAVSVLIFMFVLHEFSYDRFHQNHERIFRVMAKAQIGENSVQLSAFDEMLGLNVKLANPQVTDFVRATSSYNKVVVRNPERPREIFYEQELLFADASFLKVFSFPLSSGNVGTALSKPNGVVISERAAQKYFGTTDALGKTLTFQKGQIFEVTGVAQNPPSNSTINFDFIVSADAMPAITGIDKKTSPGNVSLNLYLLLNSPEAVARVEKFLNNSEKTKGDFGDHFIYRLENLTTIHLGNNFHESGNTRLIYIFAGIAVLILALALFNYMSLTTARATLRAKEVGVRKVVGSDRTGLIKQFYTESVLLCGTAFALAFVFMQFLKPPFDQLLDLEIDQAFLLTPGFLSFVVVLFCIVTLVAGGYPAFVLSGFKPLDVLKGRFAGKFEGAGVRKLFMVFQFAVTVCLIVCSLIVGQQVSYMQNKKLDSFGEQVLIVPLSDAPSQHLFAFRNDLRQLSGIASASAVSSGIFEGYNMYFVRKWRSKKEVGLSSFTTDDQFVKTIGLKWKIVPQPGEFQSRDYMLLNETAVKELDIAKDPIGRNVETMPEIAGIVKDFHFSSPQNPIKPLSIIIKGDSAKLWGAFGSSTAVYVRLGAKANVMQQVQEIGIVFQKHYAEKPFEYSFFDETFNHTFRTEIRMSTMFSVFTGLAIFIACIGLFGLVTFTAETRTREIGIRKVMGASIASIVSLLSKDFMKLVVVSIIIAVPAAWYFMDKWLQDFTYRIEIPIWTYAIASIAAVVIALVTVSFQSIKAALMNPVKSLRSD